MTERPYEIRDPIHGFIKLSQKEWDLINTKVFQRLRRIRQLAMSFLVYPGALHTRFDHSIGVMHIAGRICTRLQELKPERVCDKDVDRIRLAALLHDVGHGPFSHVSERLLKAYAPEDMDMGEILEEIHERITIDIVRNDPRINEILDGDERDFVIRMIQGEPTRDWRRDIVSSGLDADKMDYLLRDSYFAGVEYGRYDLEKLIESYWIREEEETPLAINRAGIYTVEQLLIARAHMTQQVYWHRISLISTEMIVRGITLAIEDGNDQMAKLYKYPGKGRDTSRENYEKEKKDFVQNYLNYHDERVIDVLKNCEQAKACKIFKRLYNRNLFKMVTEIEVGSSNLTEYEFAELKEMVENPEGKSECEKEIAKCVDLDPDYVIVSKPPTLPINYKPDNKNLKQESIMVFDERQNKLRFLREYSAELFSVRRSSDFFSTLGTVQVYAPYKKGKTDSESKKREIRNILRESVGLPGECPCTEP